MAETLLMAANDRLPVLCVMTGRGVNLPSAVLKCGVIYENYFVWECCGWLFEWVME